jgi:site-specific DNA-methyltransferase (adenine-specific)
VSAIATIQDVLEGRARWCVVHGDNAEILPTLPDASVAHVITDPPYSEHTHAKVRRGGSTHLPDESTPGKPKRAVISSAAVLGFDALVDGQREWCSAQWARVAARWHIVFSDNEGSVPWMVANLAAGLDHVRIGHWVKIGCTPQFTGDRPATGTEAIVIAHRKGRKRWNGGGTHAVWTHPIVLDRAATGSERLHTTQKPVPLMLELVELFTDPDEIIFDPFCGSGTTGIACLRLGRRCILIEKDAKYAAVARERMEAESKGLTLRDARAGQGSLFGGAA